MEVILFQIFKIVLNYYRKKHETITGENSPIKSYFNKIKNRIVFKIKTGSKLEFLIEETMKLLRSSKKEIDNNKDSELVPRLEIVDVVLMHSNLVSNNYQQESKVLITFVPDKQFGQLIAIEPKSLTMLKSTNAEFSFIEIWFTNQNNRPLEIEGHLNITLMIGTCYDNKVL